MTEEIVYMLGVIGVGFLVNYTLRALPFLLFSGRNRALPPWVDRLGKVLSPVIIGCLIVYSYTGSAWRTPWPYLAGFVTVVLQVWKKNPLMSIVAGTLVYMVLLNCCGCATQHTVQRLDATNPELRLATDGIYFGDTKVDANDLIGLLEKEGVTKDRAIHILLDRDMRDLRASRALMAFLARGGYTRSVLVTGRHGEGETKSGTTYAQTGQVRQDDLVMFVVTMEGVRFGWLTPVEPNEIVRCLEATDVKKNQTITLCGFKRDIELQGVHDNMAQLEAILKDSGYTRIKRHWMEDKKPQTAASNSSGAGSAQAAPRATGGVRYKRANE